LASRLHQVVLIVSTLVGSWLGMQAIHEWGHVLGAWATGGTVQSVVLHPLTISHTELTENPHPLIVVWAGPVLGALIPLAFWAIANLYKSPITFLLRFFAGFCLIANGLYIALGSFEGVGDSGVMLQLGSARWQLWLFGASTVPTGFWLWHKQGAQFGFGPSGNLVNARIAYGVLAGVILLAVLEACLTGS
jgi:hypothetical protein